jgi:hypothetical protein
MVLAISEIKRENRNFVLAGLERATQSGYSFHLRGTVRPLVV